MEELDALIGVWEGAGEGGFPTITPFTYREVLEVRAAEAGPSLHYVQQTWRLDDDAEVGSHYETGFITPGDRGSVAVLNAQADDRVEVLHGQITRDGATTALDLRSVLLANDVRMVKSWRRIEVDGDELQYTMGMATTAVPDGALHLTARLTRR